jgi:hypothetical protein
MNLMNFLFLVSQLRNTNGRKQGWKKEGARVGSTTMNGVKSAKRDEVVPGIELGLPESESDVLTITLYNQVVEAFCAQLSYIDTNL